MLFSSPSFLFLFLPLTLLAYFVARRFSSTKLENVVLLFFSLIFYAWGELRFVPLLVFSIVVNYVLGLALGAELAEGSRRKIFVFGIVLNLGILAVFKYAGFFIGNLDELLWRIGATQSHELVVDPKIPMPLGVSFFTFHSLSYLFDIERRRLPAQKNLPTFALYILFFPQLVAGPIIRYHDLAETLEKRTVTLDGFARSVTRFSFGFAKKMLIANQIGLLADQLFELGAKAGLSTGGAWTAGIVYALQIYFDFSGYTDMAIGLGGMFGFPFPENFNFPFIASSVTDYWQRWHISLTNWLKDYCYTPLALALGRHLPWALPFGIVITMTLSGLWHGAAWNFVLWGFFFGVIMALEQNSLRRTLKKTPPWVRHAYTLVVIIVSFVLFRATSAAQCLSMLRSMFDPSRVAAFPERSLVTERELLTIVVAIVLSVPLGNVLGERRWPAARAWATSFAALALFFLASAHAAASTYNPFIYFRF